MKRVRRVSLEELSIERSCMFSHLIEPIATVKPGEVVEIETWDCYANAVNQDQTLKDLVEKGIMLCKNPITGPIYIEDSEPGDVLVVEIIDIKLPQIGITAIPSTGGGLKDLFKELAYTTKFLKIENGKVVYQTNDRNYLEIEAKPFIGTIGLAPSAGPVSSLVPGRHGGNMDVADVCIGNKIFLPVAVEGAFFGLGDVHAVQGDGEICGTAAEVSSTVTLKFGLIKNKRIEWPRIESPEEIMVVCSSNLLEEAIRFSMMELIRWLCEDYGFEQIDAYMLLSLTARVRLAQIVNPLSTLVVKFPKRLLEKENYWKKKISKATFINNLWPYQGYYCMSR